MVFAMKGGEIIYIMLLSDLEKLLSVWENVLSVAIVIYVIWRILYPRKGKCDQ